MPSQILSILVAALSASTVLANPILLSKKDDKPAVCKGFPVGRDTDYAYLDQSNVAPNGATCIGWDQSGITCSNGLTAKQQSDAMSAMSQQLTQDTKKGGSKSTSVGDWTATFDLLTTAFDDSNPIYFDAVFQNVNNPSSANFAGGVKTWYYGSTTNYVTLAFAAFGDCDKTA